MMETEAIIVTRDAKFVQQDLLVRRCQHRQPDALHELVSVWERPLLYYIRRLVDHESDAWDVLQKTWIQVLRTIDRLQDSAALRPWLYAVARHVAASHYRPELERRQKIDIGADAAEIPADDWVPALDDALDVHEGLGLLSLDHREVLVLHFLEGMSVDEIAAVIGAPPGTVKSRLYYAKRALRSQLEKERVS